MNRDEAKKEIVAVVESVQGCKATELICHERLLPIIANFDGTEVVEMIAELCAEGELVEVEYVLPNMTYRVKTFLLPKGTEIASLQKIHNVEELMTDQIRRKVERIANESSGEAMIMPSSQVDQSTFDDLMKFQYGETDEEVGEAFERIKRRADDG